MDMIVKMVVLLESDLVILLKHQENEYPISTFPLGFFIEDYDYLANGDLDENNGRYCVTPDYPKEHYAYFATINPNENETSGTFKNFRSPRTSHI